jgi:hypothetical protein
MAKHEGKAKVVLELCVEGDDEQTVRIEDPHVIPTIGDKIDFANLYSDLVIERRIRFYGTLGPDRQCLVKVILRNPTIG